MTKNQVVIYTRSDCHLCKIAKSVIRGAGCETEFVLAEVDIDSDRELFERYKNDIPVITINGVEAFRHRLSAAAFREALKREAARRRAAD